MFVHEDTLHPANTGPVVGRVLHAVDVENLVGSTDFTQEVASWVYRDYIDAAPSGTVDQLILASSHHTAAAAWFGWPESTRRLVRSGPDGADLALLEVLERESVAERFDRVVIGSGDGIFAYAAARLQAAGVLVTVVSRRDALSRQLRLAVRDCRYLEPIEPAHVISFRARIA